MNLLVATDTEIFTISAEGGDLQPAAGLEELRIICVAADRSGPGRAWCGTDGGGLFRSDDGGASWRGVGLEGERITAVASDPIQEDTVWAGTEPSVVWRSDDGGASWERTRDLEELPSSPEWAYPPRPETHHVRWIACHPHEEGRLWVAIEAGALVSTVDGGASWRDRVPGGPWDTHELAVHPERPDVLHSAAGDGYFVSPDGGASWESPEAGLEVRYLRSVAVDPGHPDTVIVSASSRARTAYTSGRGDGHVYRRVGEGRWERVLDGWPDPANTTAPILRAGSKPGEFWALDERGVHRSLDGGAGWQQVAAFGRTPRRVEGLEVVG